MFVLIITLTVILCSMVFRLIWQMENILDTLNDTCNVIDRINVNLDYINKKLKNKKIQNNSQQTQEIDLIKIKNLNIEKLL